MLTIKLLNDLVALNNYYFVQTKEYIPNQPLNIFFQIQDEQSKNRLVPDTAATMTVTFQKSDGTELVKSAVMLFNPDDRSMWKVALTALESNDIIGSNFLVTLDFLGDATDIRLGMAYAVLSKITFDGEC